MAKSAKNSKNLLRLSGIFFAIAGGFHVTRYFTKWEFMVGKIEVTPLGSLIIGIVMGLLAFACFKDSRD